MDEKQFERLFWKNKGLDIETEGGRKKQKIVKAVDVKLEVY
jgi:hypothetical protein